MLLVHPWPLYHKRGRRAGRFVGLLQCCVQQSLCGKQLSGILLAQTNLDADVSQLLLEASVKGTKAHIHIL